MKRTETTMKRMLKWVGLSLGGLMLIGFLIPDETAARWKAEREAREAREAAEAPVRAAAVVPAEAEAATETAVAPSREKSGSISMENYLRLQTGMTIAEVEAILGGPGEEMSRVEMEGLPTTV